MHLFSQILLCPFLISMRSPDPVFNSTFICSIFFFLLFMSPFSSINTPSNLTSCPFLFTTLSLSSSPCFLSLFQTRRVSSALELHSQSKMSRKASKRVSFSPDVNDKPTIFLKHGGGTRGGGNRKKIAGTLAFRLPRTSKFSPARLLRGLSAKVARVLRFVSMRRESSRTVTPSGLPRSRSLAEAVDSQRAEAIEDCIVFLNSSSSLPRSNSFSAYSY
ncbi:JOSEPHIN-LIKE PROTEIN [Salix viminalis]|uniref:JOSEPHIN-LIKE PROTEIN n=1 Tax=Salix viminalis TaxID=40686 RepID=A0A9Q0ZPV8_SALVM|nr:JOSEPHIN-LIKE PROTEIN [Salix viminalis]